MATIDRRGATVSAADPPVATDPNPDLAIKAPVRAATTAAIALVGLQTIDGVALAADDRVLVKNQDDATTNGIYAASSGEWQRTRDARHNSQWTTGTQVLVTGGGINVATTWELTAAAPIVLGTTAMTFAVLVVAAKTPLDVIFVIGDSNVVGEGDSSQSPAVEPGTAVQYAQDGSISTPNDPVRTAFSQGEDAQTGSAWPASVNAWYAATGRIPGLVLCGKDATTQTAAADQGSGNWDASGTLVAAANAALDAALAAFRAAGYAPVERGIIVNLGANDGIGINGALIDQAQYQAALTTMLASWRTLRGNPSLPIYLIKTGSNITGGVSDTGYAQVRAAQETVVAADPFTHFCFVNTFDFVARGEMSFGAHPSQPGYNEIGDIAVANIVGAGSRIGWQQNGQDAYYTRGNVTVGYAASSGVAFAVNKAATTLPGAFAGSSGSVAQFASADTATHVEIFGTGGGPQIIARRYNGTLATPTQVATGNNIASYSGAGYDGGGGWGSAVAGAFNVIAREDWADATHRGAKLAFFTTPNATATPVEVVDIDHDGTLRVLPSGAPNLPAGTVTGVVAQFAAADTGNTRIEIFGDATPQIFMRRYNGTLASPTQVASGNNLFSVAGGGRTGAGAWTTGAAAAVNGIATESWVDATHNGAKLAFFVTPNGTATPVEKLDVNQDGTIRAYAYGAGLMHSDASGNLTSSSVVYADVQNVTAARLLGNPTGGAAAPAEISLGATLAFSGTALQTTAHTGDVTAAANSFVTTVAKIAGTAVSGTTGTGNVAFSAAPTFSGNVGIGPNADSPLTINANSGATVAPQAGTLLHIVGADSANAIQTFDAYSGGAGFLSLFFGRTARGSRGTPAAVQAGDNLFAVNGQGYDGTSAYGTAAVIDFLALDNFTTGAQGGKLRFRTTTTGTTTKVGRMEIASGVNVGGSTDPGSGNLTATGWIQSSGGGVAVASLPAAAAGNQGARAFVTDSSVAAAGNFGGIVAGAGANKVPVYSDGTNWRIG